MVHPANWPIRGVLRNHGSGLGMRPLIVRTIATTTIALNNLLLATHYLFSYLARGLAFLLLLHFVVLPLFSGDQSEEVGWALRCSLNASAPFLLLGPRPPIDVLRELVQPCLLILLLIQLYYVYYRIRKSLQSAWVARVPQPVHLVFSVRFSALATVISVPACTVVFWYYYFMGYWAYYYTSVRIAAISLAGLTSQF